MKWDNEFFQKRVFTEKQIDQYIQSAERDFAIAKEAVQVEVIFTFTYNAFLKLGIGLIAKRGYKVKSRTGHHVQIIEALSLIMNDEEITIYGNEMRRKRNMDLYAGGCLVSQKEALSYFKFVESLFKTEIK